MNSDVRRTRVDTVHSGYCFDACLELICEYFVIRIVVPRSGGRTNLTGVSRAFVCTAWPQGSVLSSIVPIIQTIGTFVTTLVS